MTILNPDMRARFAPFGLPGAGLAALALGCLVIVAALIRLHGLGAQSLSHPEIYVPGINLIAGLSEPPPRLGFLDTLYWHFHDEPHPMGWYLAMWGWTRLAGVSESALRLPSVIFAVLSIPLIHALGRRVHAAPVAMLAALMLTFHGFHVYWSQIARMYVPGVFWGLLATWLVIGLARAGRPRPGLEVAYVLAVVAGVQTTELIWPLVLLHVLWAALVLGGAPLPGWRAVPSWRPLAVPRLLQVQAVALMLAAPALSQALYRARRDAAEAPSLQFLQDYFSFGFLFAPDRDAVPPIRLDWPWALMVMTLGLVLLLASLRAAAPRRVEAGAPTGTPLPRLLAPLLALAVAGLMVWMALIAHRRGAYMLVLALLPICALALPRFGVLAGLLPGAGRLRGGGRDPAVVLLWLLAVVAPLILFAASFRVSVLAPRAFLIFMPYLVILCAAGALALAGGLRARALILCPLAAVFALSLPFSAAKPVSARDYKTIAAEVAPMMQAGDMVFVRPKSWTDTPLFYYLPHARFVAADYAAAVAAAPDARVWIISWPGEAMPEVDPRSEALAGFRTVARFTALRALAELHVPGAAP